MLNLVVIDLILFRFNDHFVPSTGLHTGKITVRVARGHMVLKRSGEEIKHNKFSQ